MKRNKFPGAAKSTSTDINCFDLFFNRHTNIIVTCTNIHIDTMKNIYRKHYLGYYKITDQGKKHSNKVNASFNKIKRKRTTWY